MLPEDPACITMQTPSTSSKSHFVVDFSNQHQPSRDDQLHAIILEYPCQKQANPEAQKKKWFVFSLSFLLAHTQHVCKSHP